MAGIVQPKVDLAFEDRQALRLQRLSPAQEPQRVTDHFCQQRLVASGAIRGGGPATDEGEADPSGLTHS